MKVVLAAGGTGGHLFPALALATELQARGAKLTVMTDARAPADAFPGCDVHVLRGSGIAGRGVVRGIRAIADIAQGVREAGRVFKPLAPDAVVAFGGYPSVAPVLAARAAGRRPVVVLHEQNAVLGRANRFLAGRADLLALSFPTTSRLPRKPVATRVTGNPVRPAIAALGRLAYRVPQSEIHLLVLGGSLGARVFSEMVAPAIASMPKPLRDRLRIVQQCRPEDIARVRESYAACGAQAELATFFPDVADKLAHAHLVLARAGASTIAELAIAGRPSILVPLPDAIDDHQSANALSLAFAGAADVLVQSEITPRALAERLGGRLGNNAWLAAAAAAARGLARPDAAVALADAVFELARGHA